VFSPWLLPTAHFDVDKHLLNSDQLVCLVKVVSSNQPDVASNAMKSV
jgi:hypothetical protein